MDAGSCRVLARIPDSVPGDGCHMRWGALASELSCFDVFLCVVPGAASIVEEQSHQNSSGSREHEEASSDLRTEEGLSSVVAKVSEDDAYQDRGDDAE